MMQKSMKILHILVNKKYSDLIAKYKEEYVD